MALEFTPSAETIDPESLFGLLSKKSILPDQFLDPMVLGAVARGVGFGVIHEKADVAAVVLTYALEPGILGVTLIKERGRWDQKQDDLKALAPDLWRYWFRDPSIRRIDSRHPVSHIQTGRVLGGLGFHRETNFDGMRDAMMINRFPTNIHVWGLLRLDVANDLNVKMEPIAEGANALE